MIPRMLAMLLVTGMVAGFLACDRVKPPAPAEEVYNPAPGAVGLDIISAGNSEGPITSWLATYSDGTTTTKFQIELERGASNNLPAAGKGKFISVPGSDPTPLLDALKEALEARHRPKSTQKVDSLSFEYELVGISQSRSLEGSFNNNPQGNWTTTRLQVGNSKAQLYFNFNPVIHKAEFAIKDREYGDRLVAEFAKVL